MFGNPETTPGGRALKFYASVRLDVRRIDSIKQGTDVVGSRVKVKVVKNKVAPPFRVAEFDIMYNEGISKEGGLLDLAVELGLVKKTGAFFSYGDTRLGQGRENAREFLKKNPEIAQEIERLIRQQTLAEPTARVEAARAPNGTGRRWRRSISPRRSETDCCASAPEPRSTWRCASWRSGRAANTRCAGACGARRRRRRRRSTRCSAQLRQHAAGRRCARSPSYWVEQRQTFRPRGARLLRAELRQHGVGGRPGRRRRPPTTRRAIRPRMTPTAPPPSAPRSSASARSTNAPSSQRLGQFLARRGFDWDAIRHGRPPVPRSRPADLGLRSVRLTAVRLSTSSGSARAPTA